MIPAHKNKPKCYTKYPFGNEQQKAEYDCFRCQYEERCVQDSTPPVKPTSPISKSILDEAKEIIYGDREKTYGDPGSNLRVIADYWNTYLRSRNIGDGPPDLQYDDVCNMMVLLKMARLGNTPLHRDSMVDACGYMALADRVHQKKTAP